MNLFIDLETVPATDIITQEDLRNAIPKTVKNEKTKQVYLIEGSKKEALVKKILKERSLSPYDCKIVCLSYSFEGEEVQALTGKEVKILEIFQTRINEYLDEHGGSITGITLVGHNIKKFDGPIMYLRACKYNLDSLKQLFYWGRKEMKDTIEMGTYHVYGRLISLDKLCNFLGVPTPKDEMDGSMVHQYFKDGKIEDIAKYCNEDVEALLQVFDKLSL